MAPTAYDLVVDASAIVSLVLVEPSAAQVAEKLSKFDRPCLPGPGYLEACMVMAGRTFEDPRVGVGDLLRAYGIAKPQFGPDEVDLAVDAFMTYGKGRHPAKLNFGDCMVYATAKLHGVPVLCVRNDLGQTDIEIA